VEEPATIIWSTFVIRLWREAESSRWRGQMVHVQSHETRPVVSLEQLAEFFTSHAPGFALPDSTDPGAQQPPAAYPLRP
jgi:hypothetical protein